MVEEAVGRGSRWAEGTGGQREPVGRGSWWAEEAIGLRERSDRLAASGASRAVQDRALRSKAQRSAVQMLVLYIFHLQ